MLSATSYPQLLVHIFLEKNEQFMHPGFLQPHWHLRWHAQTEAYRCVWMVHGYSWKVPWTSCFWPVLNLIPSQFDPKRLAPRAMSTSTSGNLDLVSVIGLNGNSFSVLPKRFWPKFWFYPWQIVSDSIAHPNPSLAWVGWSPSQTDPGLVMEHHAASRSHDHCPVFISPPALLYVPFR